jgi:hypothetical protein
MDVAQFKIAEGGEPYLDDFQPRVINWFLAPKMEIRLICQTYHADSIETP